MAHRLRLPVIEAATAAAVVDLKPLKFQFFARETTAAANCSIIRALRRVER